MKIAVRLDTSGTVPMGGYHFMAHPFAMKNDMEEALYAQMGYKIIVVTDQKGEQILEEARAALNHQVEIACLVEEQHPGSTRM